MVGDLWPGAEVRWVGPRTARRGARIEPGDRAVVVDPGRHRTTGFATLSRRRRRLPRPGRRVTIELADGTVVAASREHLEVLPPEHPLAPEPDGSHADWLVDALDPWEVDPLPVAALVPRRFPAVTRVRHPWPSDEGALDARTATTLVEVLTPATTTPREVFVAVWEGWGDVPAGAYPGAAHVPTPNRGHFLLRGPLDGVLSSIAVAGGRGRLASGLWWPVDRAWFVATEVDFAWTFVAGSGELAEAVTAHPDLEATRTTHDSPAAVPGGQPRTGP